MTFPSGCSVRQLSKGEILEGNTGNFQELSLAFDLPGWLLSIVRFHLVAVNGDESGVCWHLHCWQHLKEAQCCWETSTNKLNLLQFDAIFEYAACGAVMFVARPFKWNVISDWWLLEWIVRYFLGLLKINCSDAEAISPKHIIQQLLKSSRTVSQPDDWTCRCALCV